MENTCSTREKIYHYTDFTALHGILVNNEIWLGNVFDMNDSREMIHFMDLLKLSVVTKTHKSGEVEKLFENQIRRLRELPLYSASFSYKGDDAAQWERYGNNGAGVCIGLNTQKLREATRTQVMLQTVFYDLDVTQHKHVQLISDYIEDNSNLGEWDTIDDIFENAWACASAHKHPSFCSEDEIRLISIPGTIASKNGEQPRYRVSSNRIHEYYPLKLSDSIVKNLVTDIILGPRSKCSIDILKRYLANEANAEIDSIRISKSESPLR